MGPHTLTADDWLIWWISGEKFFHQFFCWWQPSTPQPGPKRPIVAARNLKGRPQGCILKVQHPKLKKWHFISKMGFLTLNISTPVQMPTWNTWYPCQYLCLMLKIPFLDSKCHFSILAVAFLICNPIGLLGLGWGVLGWHQQKKISEKFSPEIHQMSLSSTVKSINIRGAHALKAFMVTSYSR